VYVSRYKRESDFRELITFAIDRTLSNNAGYRMFLIDSNRRVTTERDMDIAPLNVYPWTVGVRRHGQGGTLAFPGNVVECFVH